MVSPDFLWSPTNVLIEGDDRKVFLSNSLVTEANDKAVKAYSDIGYDTVLINLEGELQKTRAGIRCASFAIKS